MKDIMSYIFSRRSIRKYLDKDVDRDNLVLLLEAAMSAPTASNNQPWEFVVVTEKEKMYDLRKTLDSAKYNAPAAIVVCGNMKFAKGEMQKYWIQDCSAAIENILLAAAGLELGGVWIAVYPNPSSIKSVSDILNIPEHVIPLGITYIGYPGEEKEPRTQFDEQRIFWEQYDASRKYKLKRKRLKHL